jgi:hypothetical protein
MRLPQPFSKRCVLAAIVTAVLIGSLQSAVAATNQLIFNPVSLRFGKVAVGQTETLTATITNAGSSSITVSTMDVNTAAFTVSRLTLPLTLGAGQSTSFTVTFSPAVTGLASGGLRFNGDGPYFVVRGWGAPRSSVFSNPPSLSFGAVPLGSSVTLRVTLTNSRNASMTISQELTVGVGFTVNGLSLPLTLTPGQSFTFTIRFSPQAMGPISGGIQVSDSANAIVGIPLAGTGIAAGLLTVSPSTMNFGNVTNGTAKTLMGKLSASGSSISISSATLSSPEFSLSGVSFPLTIAAGKSATFSVAFTPQSSGTATATVSFLSNAGDSSLVESLTGNGTAPQSYSVSLSWDASTSQVVGYNVYRSTKSGGQYSRINPTLESGTVYTDTSVVGGQTYYYVTTAVNASGVESSYSKQVQAAIP